MKHKLRFSLAVLMIMILNAGADFASAVTVRGHDGSELALSEIPDIIRHVTGQTSGDFQFKKDSLYIFGAAPQDANYYKEHIDLYTFNLDGSNKQQASLQDNMPYPLDTPLNYRNLSVAEIAKVNANDDKKHLANFSYESGHGIKSETAYVTGKADDGNARIGHGNYDRYGDLVKGILLDVKGGMTVKGWKYEVTAYLTRDDKTINVTLGYASPDDNDDDAFAFSVLADFGSWSTTLNDSDVPKMLDGTVYFPVSMTVGDFNNDGYKNEIAVVYSDRTAVRYAVLQVTLQGDNEGGGGFNVSVLKNDTVDTYNYTATSWDGYDVTGQYQARGGNMDGISCTYSVCTVTGDFDGDGQIEFAVIWRDTSPNANRDVFKWFYTGNSFFAGYTGKIHVRTYKWNGSGFQTEEDVRGFDILGGNDDDYHRWRDLDLTLGVKAAVGDFDGDGRDDIAVLRVMLQYTEFFNHVNDSFSYSNYVFGAFVDWYSFDTGSIKPNYHGHSNSGRYDNNWNYGDNKNGWVGIRTTNMWMPHFDQVGIPVGDDSQETQIKVRQQYYIKPITGEDLTPYPVIDREFDIIAGKFSGTIGEITTRDDLVIKYPQWTGDGSNRQRSHVALMTNIPGVSNWGTQVHEIMSLSDRDHLLAFAKSDFLTESVTLGAPVKTVDRADLDYTAILQMMPYHVDNITPDGKSLTDKPQNFTLLLDAHIDYKNTSTSSDQKSMTYSMTSTAETIFALDSKLTQGAAKTFQGVRGITSTFLGNTTAGKAIEGVGKFWDKLKDTVETTKSTSNTSEYSSMMSIATQANYLDTLYVNTSDRYIWRYPVTNPPSWILEQTLSSYGTFDKSKAKTQQTYITFAMSEPGIPTAAKGTNDSHYQPYHESGNLFSYPAALEQIEGYEGHKSLLGGGSSAAKRWDGSAISETITFVNTTTDQESTKKTNKAGAITKFLSAVDNIFGSSFANVPYDTVSSFTRNVSNKESISVNIPGALSGAQFSAVFEPFLDVTGATVVGFAVESFRDIDALWNQDSLYSKKPDPSFLLPEKFNCTSLAQSVNQFAEFSVNTNDETAMKGRGIRYTAADYDMETNNLLMNGVKYKITIPVYNASFVTAPEFKVRLSYTGKLDYSVKKTTIGEYTFTSLPGRGKGNHRQFAEFEWTPNVEQGIYYLFAEIDPDNKLKDGEVHKNRHVSSSDRTIADYGGNNMAYFKIGISNTDTVPFDRTKLETQYRSASFGEKFAAADISPSEFPFVEYVKIDGLDFEEFIAQKVDGQTEPVAGEVEVKYVGEELMTDAVLIGYALKPESSNKSISEINDADIGLLFVKEHFALFPGEDHKLHFRINPNDLSNGVGFLLQVYGQEYPLTDIIYGSAGTNTGFSSSSSGGCETFAGSMAGVLALILIIKNRRS